MDKIAMHKQIVLKLKSCKNKELGNPYFRLRLLEACYEQTRGGFRENVVKGTRRIKEDDKHASTSSLFYYSRTKERFDFWFYHHSKSRNLGGCSYE